VTVHKYFKLKGVEPGKIVTKKVLVCWTSERKIPLPVLKELYFSGFPYTWS
jgi:hypothetical protein